MILVYSKNCQKIIDELRALNLEYKCISDLDFQKKMKDLLMQPVIEGTCTKEDFLYLDGVNEEQMKSLDENVHVLRVAVSTPTNLEWNLEQLMEEIEKEYNYFKVRNDLYQILIHPNKERLNMDSNYLKQLAYAFSLYENEKTPVEILQQVLDALR